MPLGLNNSELLCAVSRTPSLGLFSQALLVLWPRALLRLWVYKQFKAVLYLSGDDSNVLVAVGQGAVQSCCLLCEPGSPLRHPFLIPGNEFCNPRIGNRTLPL